MSRAEDTDAAKSRAEARFKKRSDMETLAAGARQDVADEKAAEAAKTIRLRALRLAKEEADRAAAIAAGPPKPKARASRKK